MIFSAYSKIPFATQIRRMTQVSNGANSTVTVANVPSVLPLNGDGPNNRAFNNDIGYGSADLVNNWFDVRKLHPRADMTFRVTVSNNAGGGLVNGANIVVRLIPSIASPGVYIDAPSTDLTFRGQAQFMLGGYTDYVEAVQICIRTTAGEDVRCLGIYLSIDDVVPILGGL